MMLRHPRLLAAALLVTVAVGACMTTRPADWESPASSSPATLPASQPASQPASHPAGDEPAADGGVVAVVEDAGAAPGADGGRYDHALVFELIRTRQEAL